MIVLSEYGIVPVDTPVHINRALREAGLLAVRDRGRRRAARPAAVARLRRRRPPGRARLRRRARRDRARCARSLERLDGVGEVSSDDGKRAIGLDHPRSGELVAIAEPDAWFTYYYWLDDARAPDFARTVEIHRKPGYDPVELFLDPAIAFPKLAVGWRLAQEGLGLRTLMDVIPLDATLGARLARARRYALCARARSIMSSVPATAAVGTINAAEVKQLMLDHMFGADCKLDGRPSMRGCAES